MNKNGVKTGCLCFMTHFVTETICFCMLYRMAGPGLALWTCVFAYDALSFAPQVLIGRIKDRYHSFSVGTLGFVLLGLSCAFFSAYPRVLRYTGLVVLCMGNCCTHIEAADITLRTGEGKVFPAAVYVAGGSFGVVTGKLLDMARCPFWVLSLLAAAAIPIMLLAEFERDKSGTVPKCSVKADIPEGKSDAAVLLVAFFVVAIRSFTGYGIPTSWNKSTWQTVLLFSMMGAGKALGGLAVDRLGVKKTATLSIVISVPFLLFGDRIMIVSLIGVLLFSMTMAATLAMIVSIMPSEPGFAFGITTLGLFTGALLPLVVRISSIMVSDTIVCVCSVMCLLAVNLLNKE